MAIYLPPYCGSHIVKLQNPESAKKEEADFVTNVGRQVTVYKNGVGHPLDVQKCRKIFSQMIDYDSEIDEPDMAYYELLLQLKKGVDWRAALIQKHGDPLKFTELTPRQQEIWTKSIEAPFNRVFGELYGLKAYLTVYSTCRHDPKELIAEPA
jgi:hypothetical protein